MPNQIVFLDRRLSGRGRMIDLHLDHPQRDLSLQGEAKLLKMAFLSNNIVAVLGQIGKGGSITQGFNDELLDRGIAFLEQVGDAWSFVHDHDHQLIPSSDLVEAVVDLSEGGEPLNATEIGGLVDISKDVLAQIRNQPEIAPENLESALRFFRALQTISMAKLDQPDVDAEAP